VTTNLKTYLLKGIGFFFMRKTELALMISTPIANSLINYAQLLQTKKHGSIISVVGKTTVEIIELFECRQKVP